MSGDQKASGGQASEVAERAFGISSLKPEQSAAANAAIAGRDVLGVLPTGFGKSLCYQVPAIARGGVCLVVEPTVSLVRDQASGLRSRGLEVVDFTAATPQAERRDRIDAVCRSGGFIIVSPEMALSLARRGDLPSRFVSLVVIDEAHCYHEWGRSFRPDYLDLPDLLARFPAAPRMCLTASATEDCLRTIGRDLLRDPAFIRAGLDRQNIHFSVLAETGVSGLAADAGLASHLASRPHVPTLIYRSSRLGAEATATALAGERKTGVYHGGLDVASRDRVHRGFMAGDLDVVCATSAFGMGIDKPDIGLVLHLDLPTDLESCHQQNGRAGRDGRPAGAILLRRRGDVGRAYARLRDLEGEKRRRAAIGLEWVMAMIEAPRCRNRAVLWRFGERLDHGCGHCDLCDLDQSSLSDEASSFRRFTEALNEFRSPPSMGQAAAFCGGFRSEAIERQRLDRLPGYGLIQRGVDHARSILRQWLADGLLSLDDHEGHLTLAAAGDAVVRGQRGAFVRVPTRAPRAPRTGDGLPPTLVALWVDLLQMREKDPVMSALTEHDILEIASGRIDDLGLDERMLAALAPRLARAHERPRPKGFDV